MDGEIYRELPFFQEGVKAVIEGSYGEAWSLRKVLRRFIWHDRIHAKAMYLMAVKLFGVENVADTFYFRLEKDMITYEKAEICDIERIYCLCKQLIDDYENIDRIDYEKVMKWVRRKIESSIDEYTAVYVSGEKAGYYHFYQNEDGEYEIDDLYIFSEYQNRGIGTEIIKKCCSSVNAPVMLYVFVKNEKAVALYQRLGFKVIRTVNGSRYVMRRER